MEYIIHLKWGGIHGDVILKNSSGEILYTLQSSRRLSRKFPVIDVNGTEVFQVRKKYAFLRTEYHLYREEDCIAKTGTNWCGSQGRIQVSGMLEIRCKYGWGMYSKLPFYHGKTLVAEIKVQRGIGVKGLLRLQNEELDDAPFLIACALVFCDWTSRD